MYAQIRHRRVSNSKPGRAVQHPSELEPLKRAKPLFIVLKPMTQVYNTYPSRQSLNFPIWVHWFFSVGDSKENQNFFCDNALLSLTNKTLIFLESSPSGSRVIACQKHAPRRGKRLVAAKSRCTYLPTKHVAPEAQCRWLCVTGNGTVSLLGHCHDKWRSMLVSLRSEGHGTVGGQRWGAIAPWNSSSAYDFLHICLSRRSEQQTALQIRMDDKG